MGVPHNSQRRASKMTLTTPRKTSTTSWISANPRPKTNPQPHSRKKSNNNYRKRSKTNLLLDFNYQKRTNKNLQKLMFSKSSHNRRRKREKSNHSLKDFHRLEEDKNKSSKNQSQSHKVHRTTIVMIISILSSVLIPQIRRMRVPV